MTASDCALCPVSWISPGLASRVCSGVVLVLLTVISAKATEPVHAPTPSQKLASPPVLSIGTITIAPTSTQADGAKPNATTRTQAVPRHSRRPSTYKFRLGDLPVPSYLLDRA